MTTFINNMGGEVSVTDYFSNVARKSWRRYLGTTYMFARVSEFQCVVGDDDIFIGKPKIKVAQIDYSTWDRWQARHNVLGIITEKTSRVHPYGKDLFAAIRKEVKQINFNIQYAG